MGKFLSLLLCGLLLSGCTNQPETIVCETTPPTVPTTAVTEPSVQETTLPAEILRPVETEPLSEYTDHGALVQARDQVPLYDPQTKLNFPIASQQDDGSPLQSSYYHIDTYGHMEVAPGVFRICMDPPEMRQGSHYGVFVMEESGLKELSRRTLSRDLTVIDTTVHVEFEYSQYEDQVILTYIAPQIEDYTIHSTTSVGPGKLLISVRCMLKDIVEVDYPVILDVKTGTVRDFLSGIGRSTLPSNFMKEETPSYDYYLHNTAFFEGDRLLAKLMGGSFVLYDPPTGRCYDLETISGRPVTDCAVMDGDILCWNGVDDFWRIDVETMLPDNVLEDVPYVEFASGIWQENGCSFALYRDDNWDLHIFDFLTMEDTVLNPPEGWTLEGHLCHPSPDGRKLYMSMRNEKDVMQLLVLDCDRKQFLELLRENENSVSESYTSWTDDNALVVQSDTQQDFYVYRWKEKEETVTQTQQTQLPVRADADFVAVRDYIPDILVDLKYAQPENFTGQTIYEFQDAYLRYGTVMKLVQVQEELKTMGLGFNLWDGFRPTAAQFKLWEIYPNSTYVANPNVGFSSHSRGNTVDITLVDSYGREMNMPTEFDDFSAMADRDYSDCPQAAADNARLLEGIMGKNGFTGYFGEWWHFADNVRYEVEHCFDPSLISQWCADCEEFITLRAEPNTAAEAIAQIPAGDQFTRLGSSGEFYLVEYQGQRGYVLSSYTKPI